MQKKRHAAPLDGRGATVRLRYKFVLDNGQRFYHRFKIAQAKRPQPTRARDAQITAKSDVWSSDFDDSHKFLFSFTRYGGFDFDIFFNAGTF